MLHPNVVTILSIFFFLPGLYFLSSGDSLLGSLFIIGALSDIIDGSVARQTGKSSAFGGVLDATVDRFTEGLLLMAIGIGKLASWEVVFMLFNLSICVSYIKAKAEAATGTSKVGKNRFSIGIGQRGDRMLIILIACIGNYFISNDSNEFFEYTLIFLSVMVGLTLVTRARAIWMDLR